MKAIWTRDKAEYHGEFVNFAPIMAWPKPYRKPHPPVLVGGAFPYSARRAVRYGDGWVPGSTGGHRDIVDLIPRFRQMAAEAGRDPDSLPITAWYPARDLALIQRYHELGVERAVFTVPSAKADIVLPLLDEIGAIMAKVNA